MKIDEITNSRSYQRALKLWEDAEEASKKSRLYILKHYLKTKRFYDGRRTWDEKLPKSDYSKWEDGLVRIKLDE